MRSMLDSLLQAFRQREREREDTLSNKGIDGAKNVRKMKMCDLCCEENKCGRW